MNNKHPGGRPRKAIAIPENTLPGKEAFTVPEVAALTGLHVRTIQARLRDGTLKGKRLGGSWYIYRDSLINHKVVTDLNIERK